jgi:GNAT superfamily N-acetyltransferase
MGLNSTKIQIEFIETNHDMIQIKSPQQSDADDIVRLINYCSQCERGVSILTAADLDAMWNSPGFNLQTDAWIAVNEQGEIVGYLSLEDEHPHINSRLWGRIHPDYVATVTPLLLQVAEFRAQQSIPKAPVDSQISLLYRITQAQHISNYLVQRSYEPIRNYWLMLIELESKPDLMPLPAGITIRTAVLGQDEQLVYEADNEIFQDHWGFTTIPYDTWRHLMTASPDNYDPSLWFLAFSEEKLVGFAMCNPHLNHAPDFFYSWQTGWINIMGVRRDWRRQGIAKILLNYAFRAFYDRGQTTIALAVDATNPSGATNLYKNAGMHIELELMSYRKILRKGQPLPNESL